MSEVMQHKVSESTVVTLSQAAIDHILLYLSKNKENRGVRFTLKKSGCSGYTYIVEYITDKTDMDLVQSLSDDYILCVDKESLPYLKGMHVDYVKHGLNSKFVFNNPNQTGQCGCGESFTIS
jgi:iron-sulfur cluster assembly accessory protein